MLAWLGEDWCRREIARGDNLTFLQMMAACKTAIGKPDETVNSPLLKCVFTV